MNPLKNKFLKQTRKGDEIVPNFLAILDWVSVPVIPQQMIIHGVPFNVDKKEKKEDLIMIINNSTWSDQVKKDTAERRLKLFKEEHGFLPLENVKMSQTEASSLGERRLGPLNTAPKAKAKTQAKSQPASSSNEPPTKTQPASSSNEPPKTQARDRIESISSMSSEDVSHFQQAPIVLPSKANPTMFREHLAQALIRGTINDIADVDLYNRIKDVREYKRAAKARKHEILKTLRNISSKYVYEPANVQRRKGKLEAQQRRPQAQPTNV